MKSRNIREVRAFQLRMKSLISGVLLLLLIHSSFATFAQNRAVAITSVTGRITDERGASIEGAEVVLRSRNGSSDGAQFVTRTRRDGLYSFTNLEQGDYVLEVKARGFAAYTTENFRLERGRALTRDAQLSLKAIDEAVVIIATGTPQRADEVAKSVTVLDEQTIEAKHDLTLAESLRGTPGLRVQQQGSPGALTGLRFRGQRNYDTAILLDGLRVRDAADINGSAAPFFADLLPVDLDRVEILRGSGSSIYGTNAIGGVINIVPKTGADKTRFEASVEAGSLGTARERLQASGGINKRVGYSFSITRLDVRRGVDGNDQYGNTASSARLQFSLTPSINLSANFYATIANARVNNSPFALAPAFATNETYPLAVEGVTFQPDYNNPDQGRRNRLLVGSVRLTQRINGALSYTIAYQRVASHRRNYNGIAVDPRYSSFTPFGDFAYNSTNNGTTDTLDARANVQIGQYNLATIGFEFERESFFQENIPSFSALNDTTDRQRTTAIFGQDQIYLFNERLQISVGARAQGYRIRAADRPNALRNVTAESSITGDGAVAYFFRSTNTKLRAHVGNGFRAPSLYERFGEVFLANGVRRLGDPTLRAEQSIGADGGFDQRLMNDRLRFGATYFYTRLQRVIGYTAFQVDPLGLGRFAGYTNQAGGRARGLESYLEIAPLSGTNVHVSYTYTNSDRFAPMRGLEREFVIPKHLFGLNVRQRYKALLLNFDLNHTAFYIAPVFENDLLNFSFREADLRFAGYTKADLFASYERALSERIVMTLFAGAENIFNERYFENGFRTPGATGRGGVSFRF